MIKVIFDGGQIAELNNVERIIIDWADQLRITKTIANPDTLEEVIIFKEEKDETMA